ncbi:MAG: thioredoxin family protein [Deltaproteobacteria bacterium]|nr:thioredoxin family protein [Deltaproteobacteria bacterium]
MRIEVIGLDPPCEKCDQLLENAKRAAAEAGIEAEVVKLWVLSEEVRQKYGLPLSPALAIDGVLVAQGKVFSVERIISLLKG